MRSDPPLLDQPAPSNAPSTLTKPAGSRGKNHRESRRNGDGEHAYGNSKQPPSG